MKKPHRCPSCGGQLGAPEPLPDSLPGITGYVCHGCGYSRPITVRPRRERLPAGRVCIVCHKPGGTSIARVGYAHGGECARIARERANMGG